MSSSNPTISSAQEQWEHFCEYLWFDDTLGFWVDISKMSISKSDFERLETDFHKAFVAMNKLENGTIANIDEARQVGHYWLRNPSLSPTKQIAAQIQSEIKNIKSFSSDVIKGNLRDIRGNRFTDVLWIGIGGSSLGPILLYNSLNQPNSKIKFHFLDNVDSLGIRDQLDLIGDKLKNTLVVVVSKSGGTIEPRICMEQAKYRFHSQGIDWNTHAVAITMKDSLLDTQASNEDWLIRFDLPDWVGGRTSITSSVGLLAISLMGLDLDYFLEGASVMDDITRIPAIKTNPAALLSAAWYLTGDAKGKKDMVVLPYKDRLEVFSKYLQQLVMESLGKKNDRNGVIVNQGLSVYGNKGSTDQHAYIQQLRDGLDNFFAIFIEILKDSSPNLQEGYMNPNDYLSGFMQGTRKALTEANRQNITISIKELNEFSLGALIALFERAVGLYAELINVNAYDQPGVESGKIAAAEIIDIQNKLYKSISKDKEYTISMVNDYFSRECSEDLFFILRTMYVNQKITIKSGEWSNPNTLRFKFN